MSQLLKHCVETGTTVVNNAGQPFAQIASLVEKVSSQVSKHTVAETQTISVATEEQSASMEEMAASSQRFSQMAITLENAVKQFRI